MLNDLAQLKRAKNRERRLGSEKEIERAEAGLLSLNWTCIKYGPLHILAEQLRTAFFRTCRRLVSLINNETILIGGTGVHLGRRCSSAYAGKRGEGDGFRPVTLPALRQSLVSHAIKS